MFDVNKDRLRCLVANAIHDVWKKETGSLSAVLIEGTICVTTYNEQNIVIQVDDQFAGARSDDDETTAENQNMDRERNLLNLTEHPYEILKDIAPLQTSSTMWTEFVKQHHCNTLCELEDIKNDKNNNQMEVFQSESVKQEDDGQPHDICTEDRLDDVTIVECEKMDNNDSAIHDMSFGELVIDMASEEMSCTSDVVVTLPSAVLTPVTLLPSCNNIVTNGSMSSNSEMSKLSGAITSTGSILSASRVEGVRSSSSQIVQPSTELGLLASHVQNKQLTLPVSSVHMSVSRFQFVPGIVRQFQSPYHRVVSSPLHVRAGYSIALIDRLKNKISRNMQRNLTHDNIQHHGSLPLTTIKVPKLSLAVDDLTLSTTSSVNLSEPKRCISAPATEFVETETQAEPDNSDINLSIGSSSELQKVYACNLCDKTFLFKSKYQEHLPVHTSDRPFQCSLCSRTYKYKYDLRVHMRTHLGIPTKSTVCPVCATKFVSNKVLRQHIKDLHQDIPSSSYETVSDSI